MTHQWVGDLFVWAGHLCVLVSIGVVVRLIPSNMFSDFLTDALGFLMCGVLCFSTFPHGVLGQE